MSQTKKLYKYGPKIINPITSATREDSNTAAAAASFARLINGLCSGWQASAIYSRLVFNASAHHTPAIANSSATHSHVGPVHFSGSLIDLDAVRLVHGFARQKNLFIGAIGIHDLDCAFAVQVTFYKINPAGLPITIGHLVSLPNTSGEHAMDDLA